MSYITKSMTIIITLYSITSGSPVEYDFHMERTREVVLRKQGKVQGRIVQLRNYSLPRVEIYRGIPYAAPPVGEFRFMPPNSNAPSWKGVKYLDHFGPVCPQKFPDMSTLSSERRQYINRLKLFLKHESEDCLYLNIYAPHQESQTNSRTYPVIVFLHGESFEWNSGNPYDGSVLAAYGQVIVVTLNFRLGILGFLKVEAAETTSQSNFGLVDQVAALIWIKDNIDDFGGDSSKITLMGHGTGAVFASLLTISPMAMYGENKRLFHRAILMSGTALSDWALVSKPLDMSLQVGQILNCQLPVDFAGCLRRKRLDELMAANPDTEPYKTIFGPVVDNLIVPNDPRKSMMQYTDIFKRFELMYGVTQMESIHLPLGGDVALIHGMLENERDEELRKYMRMRCEMKPETCFAQTSAKYNYHERMFQRDQGPSWMSLQPDRATLARDELLDILSDARTVAPVIQTGLYHSALHIQSYFYVFSHKTHSKEYIRNKTYNGEELPYVFGVPIEGPKFHFEDVPYTEDEKRLSMTIMRYFCKFANTGNPTVPKTNYFEMDYNNWHRFDREWLQFDPEQQNFINLDVPISNGRFYRSEQMEYWNDAFPNILNLSRKNPLPWITPGSGGTVEPFRPDPIEPLLPTPPKEVTQSSSSVSVLMIVGALFLLANLAFFTFLYFKCIRSKKDSPASTVQMSPVEESAVNEPFEKEAKLSLLNNCNFVKLLRKGERKEDDTYDAVHVETKGGLNHVKLTRNLSTSTIDAHAKVREWITNEIVLKYSPKGNRKPEKKAKPQKKLMELDSSVDHCPTRPVSPEEEKAPKYRPLLIKTASIDRSNRRKRIDKVSVAIDATPSGRGPSVLMQQPIELTKSLDNPNFSPSPLRRSVTLEDFSQSRPKNPLQDLRKSITSIDLKSIETEPRVIRIEHGHSKSDPVQDLDYSAIKRLKTFDPNMDVNVTSRETNLEVPPPMTPEEALQTIKRRNFPKVLPDHPGRQAFLNKRRSMPAHNLYVPMLDIQQYSNSEPYSPTGRNFMRFPPVPPPRTTTLGRQGSNPQPVCLSEPMLAEEPPASPEPEVACNNLYVGPLIPRSKNENSRDRLDSIPEKSSRNEARAIPRAIITTNQKNPIKRNDAKVVVKPTINRSKPDKEPGSKHIPRVVASDNRPEISKSQELLQEAAEKRAIKKSQIPMLLKSNTSLNKEVSSSESNSPSSGDSDTGTVVKRI
nr:carboxylesterase COEL1 [Dendroctonus rhizophagus]